MLDTDTKRRIDTARDILVGKVPEGKALRGPIACACGRRSATVRIGDGLLHRTLDRVFKLDTQAIASA